MNALPDDDDDAFAAEFALGTLGFDERAVAERRRQADPAFAASVDGWNARFSPLLESVEPQIPPAAVFDRILSRIQGSGPETVQPVREAEPQFEPAVNVVELKQRLRQWRGASVALAALAAALAVWVATIEMQPSSPAGGRYVAVLQQGADSPAFIVSVDLDRRQMTVTPSSTNQPPDRSYELWMIDADKAPRSLGLIRGDASVHPTLANIAPQAVSHAVYAVTLEPAGGSPTGQPTSKPIFIGKLTNEGS